MLKKNKWKLLISSLVILLPVVFGLLFWNQLPEQMSTHWGMDGAADGSSSRFTAVFVLPLILLLAQLVCVFFTAKDPGNKEQNEKVFGLVLWIIPMISLVTNGVVYAVAFGKELEPVWVMGLLLGVVFVAIGNYLPKCKQNFTIGIKLKWTLQNEENWYATHRFGGKMFVAVGLVTLAAMFLPQTAAMTVIMIALFAAALLPVFYSYLYYKKQVKEGTAAVKPVPQLSRKAKTVSNIMVAVILLLCAVLMFTGEITVQYEENAFTIKASYWNDLTVEYDAIDSIEYREENMDGVRSYGLGTARLLAGTFQNEEFGAYTRYTYAGTDACVVLKANGKTLVLNGPDVQSTQAIYETIKANIE